MLSSTRQLTFSLSYLETEESAVVSRGCLMNGFVHLNHMTINDLGFGCRVGVVVGQLVNVDGFRIIVVSFSTFKGGEHGSEGSSLNVRSQD